MDHVLDNTEPEFKKTNEVVLPLVPTGETPNAQSRRQRHYSWPNTKPTIRNGNIGNRKIGVVHMEGYPHVLTNHMIKATTLSTIPDEDLEQPTEQDPSEITCYCCLAKYHQPPQGATFAHKLRYIFMCPPHGRAAKIITLALIGFLFWATFWSVLGKKVLPGSNFFGIIWVWLMSAMFGFGAEICGVPRLLGTLIGGVVSSNVPVINFGRDVDRQWSFALRKMAIVIVLIRAGLGVDLRALWRYKYVIARIGSIPMFVEGASVAVASRFLFSMPWKWAFLTGYTIAPMSAAAIIPFMLGFHNSGLGINQGVPSIVKLGAVLDNVLGLCVFSTFVGVVFTEENAVITILKLFPLQIAVGIVGGFIVGFILWYFPRNNSQHKVLYRFIFLLGGCVVGAFATGLTGFSSAGPLANVVIAIVAVYKWKQQGWTRTKNPLIPIFSNIWIGTQIMLSGLIGALVDIKNTNWEVVGISVGVLTIGMTCRLISQFFMAQYSHLNKNEKVFLVIAWIPKATIQAAIGSIAYDKAVDLKLPSEDIHNGLIIFKISVISIALWACVGALAIVYSGPRLLTKTRPKLLISTPERLTKDACVQTDWTQKTSHLQDIARLYRIQATPESVPTRRDPLTVGIRQIVDKFI